MTDEGTAVQHSLTRTGQGTLPLRTAARAFLMATAALLGPCIFGLSVAVAQDAAGGLRLTYGVNLRAEMDSNADLDNVTAGRTLRASTGLSFGLSSETRSARFALDAGVILQAEDSPNASNNGLVNPYVTLSYARDAANAVFSLDASLRETDLSTDRDVTDFDADSGIRRVAKVDTTLRWGEDRPLGFGLTAGFADTRYQNAPGEADTTVARLGLTARMELSKTSRLDLGLRASRYDEAGAARIRDTLGFDASFIITRPRGDLGVHLSIDDTEDGQRQSLSFRNNLDLPRGSLAYGLGASRGVNGKTRLIGSLDYSLILPNGGLTFAVNRSVEADDLDAESIVTSASFGYQQELTPLSNLRLSANWATSETTATGVSTTNASFGAFYSHDLTQDWALDIGYRHRLREAAGVGKARSNSVFLGLRREVSVRR